MKYLLESGDCIIEDDGECRLITESFDAVFDENGLLSGTYDYDIVCYLDVRRQFDDGYQILDLAGDYPGLWEH